MKTLDRIPIGGFAKFSLVKAITTFESLGTKLGTARLNPLGGQPHLVQAQDITMDQMLDEPPVKRRRGRPKGSKKQRIDTAIPLDDNNAARSQREQREPRNYNVKQTFKTMLHGNQVLEAQTDTGSVSKRGRPKGSKNKPKAAGGIAVEAEAQKAVSEGIGIKVERRGRPKGSKNKKTLEKEALNGAGSTDPHTGEKRKRGRPRKVHVADLVQSVEGPDIQSTTPSQKMRKKVTKTPVVRRTNVGMEVPSPKPKSGIESKASTFHDLPKEIQEMIWTTSITELEGAQNLVEVVYDRNGHRWVASGAAVDILTTWGSSREPLGVKPIYLPPSRGASAVADSGSSASPIYLRPEHDILYIPDLRDLNIPQFLSNLKNQVLQNLAITWPTARRFELPSRTFFDIVRGLKNLRKIYILEGQEEGSEDRVDRSKKYIIELSDVAGSWSQHNPPQSRVEDNDPLLQSKWNSENFEAIRSSLGQMFAEIDEASTWVKPQIVGCQVKRTWIPESETVPSPGYDYYDYMDPIGFFW